MTGADPDPRPDYAPTPDPPWFRRLVIGGVALGVLVVTYVVGTYVYWGGQTGTW